MAGEFGIDAIESYGHFRDANGRTYDDTPDLLFTFNIANGLFATLLSAGYRCLFYWAETNAWANDLIDTTQGGIDEFEADNVDLFFFAGHSYVKNEEDEPLGDHAETIFDSNHDAWSSSSRLWRLGDVDLHWLALYTCGSIDTENYLGQWIDVFDRLHLVLGAYGSMWFGSSTAHIGSNVAENLVDGDTFVAAWLDGTTVFNHPAVISAEQEDTWNGDWWSTTIASDHLWGHGPVKPSIPKSRIYWMAIVWRHT